MTVLVTGGAGYVGSQAVKTLREHEIPCVVLDNLSRGHAQLVKGTDLIVGDIADPTVVRQVFADYGVTAVMHFAAYAYVGESVRDPAIYYQNNVVRNDPLAELHGSCRREDDGVLVYLCHVRSTRSDSDDRGSSSATGEPVWGKQTHSRADLAGL